jgi:ABC-type polysaccharide/polyol phosphate export permease
MFIGGIAIPPFILPKYLRAFAQNWPLGKAVEAMRASLLFEVTASEALRMGLWSIAASIILYLIGVLMYKRMLSRTIEYY